MDRDLSATSTTKAPKKLRFAPKAPPKREQKPVLPKVEEDKNDIDAAKAEQLLRRYNEASLRGKPKFERKVGPVQVAFGYGGSSPSIKSYGAHKGINQNKGSSSHGGSEQKVEKEYKEPWDYYTYYPVTLPLRRPYSGNPELLDGEEFGEDPQTATDEYATNSVAELGLLDENLENSMFFFQLPMTMPAIKQSANAEVNKPDNNANPTIKGKEVPQNPCNLEALPAGLMGKMLVYKSGTVKLKLGKILYNVSPGLNCVFAQDVVAVNTEQKHCCNVGELNKRAVITPDVESMLDAMSSL